MDTEPVIEYSPWRFLTVAALGLCVTGAMLAVGLLSGSAVLTAAAAFGFVVAVLFAASSLRRLRGGEPALLRRGTMLVGGELREPLPVSGTTFEVTTDNQGGWMIVLRPQAGRKVVLQPGGWTIDRRPVRRDDAAAAMLRLGLTQQP